MPADLVAHRADLGCLSTGCPATQMPVDQSARPPGCPSTRPRMPVKLRICSPNHPNMPVELNACRPGCPSTRPRMPVDLMPIDPNSRRNESRSTYVPVELSSDACSPECPLKRTKVPTVCNSSPAPHGPSRPFIDRHTAHATGCRCAEFDVMTYSLLFS